MQCSKETIVRLFYNTSSSFQLLFLFFYLTSIFLSKFLFFVSAIPFLPRNDEEYEYATFSEEEEEEEENNGYYYEESLEKDHLVADIAGDGEELSFLHGSATSSCQNSVVFDEHIINHPIETAVAEEEVAVVARSSGRSDDLSFYSPPESESEEPSNQENLQDEEEEEVADTISSLAARSKSASTSFRYEVNTPAITTRAKSACTSFRYVGDEPSLRVTKKIAFVIDDEKIEGILCVWGKEYALFDSQTCIKNLYVTNA